MGDDPVPESNLAMLTGISPFRCFFPKPIVSAAPNSIIYCLRINRLYTMKEEEEKKKDAFSCIFCFCIELML